MKLVYIIFDILNADTANPADRIGEIFINYFMINAKRFKYLGTLVGLDGGNSHFGCYFYNTSD